MSGHVHFDAVQLTFTAIGVFLIAQIMRAGAAFAANHGLGTVGHAVGAFFTLSS